MRTIYQIAICDDQAEDLYEAGVLVQSFLDMHTISMRLHLFPSSSNLLSNLEDGAMFDIFLLDVIMPMTDGIELAGVIRKYSSRAVIVYLSASSDYAVKSYSVQAFDYLLKPVEREALFGTLERAIMQLNRREYKPFPFKTKGGLLSIEAMDVMLCEGRGHRLYLTLKDGQVLESVTLRESFSDMAAPLLEKAQFMKTGASFAVNPLYVQVVESNRLVLKNGTSLNLSRSVSAQVRRSFLRYLMEGDL